MEKPLPRDREKYNYLNRLSNDSFSPGKGDRYYLLFICDKMPNLSF